jgi:hypothetical protein
MSLPSPKVRGTGSAAYSRTSLYSPIGVVGSTSNGWCNWHDILLMFLVHKQALDQEWTLDEVMAEMYFP